MLKRLFCLLLCFLSFSFAFAADQKPIPAEQAFEFSVRPTNTDSVLAIWNIMPGYYLYKDRFAFDILSPKAALLGEIVMPKGIEKDDQILGKHYVYETRLRLSIPTINSSQQPLQLLVHYQGCAVWGFCYPPVTKLVTILNKEHLTANDIQIKDYENPAAAVAASTAAAQTTATNQNRESEILQNKNSLLALLIFFGFGLLLAFTPCVLPMIPILSSIIVGQGQSMSTKHAFGLSLSYVLGMAVAFAVAGLIVGLLGNSVQAALQTPWVLILFSLLFVILALSLFGFYELRLPQVWQQKINLLNNKQKSGRYLSVALMGALSTLIVSPCVSAPLVGALIYIGNTGNALFGGLALFALGLGMGFPLLIIGTSFGKFLPRSGGWMEDVKIFFGILMLGVAIWILDRIVPAYVTLALWGVLAIIAAVFIGAFSPVKESSFSKLCKGIGLALFVYGAVLLVGGSMGNTDFFQPIKSQGALSSTGRQSTNALNFQPVKSIADVDAALQQNQGKLVMLDFYADWCVSCKEMDAYTFSNSEVKTALKNIVLLRANVTPNDATDKALEKKYGVIAPPTILFFDKNGSEIQSARIIGEMNAAKFVMHLQKDSIF